MRSMAEASFEQARRGFEKFLAGAQAARGLDHRARRRRQGHWLT
jgi:hypothetical protein